jgi:type VI protein secretion system component Hcp
MTKEEREQTDQLTELTSDEMEGVSGGFITVRLTEVFVSSISTSGHGGGGATESEKQ